MNSSLVPRTLSLLLFTVYCLLLTGCSPQQRLNRLVNHHPNLVLPDTIHYSRTLVRPFRSAFMNMPDSVYYRMVPGDSVTVIDKNGIVLTVHRKQKSTEFSATIPPDTVKLDTTIIAKTVKVVPKDRVRILRLRLINTIAVILLILVIYALIRKYIGR